jgi:Tol biopolymer transport system component
VFSRDGRQIAFVRTLSSSVQDIYITEITGGEPRRLTNYNRRVFGMTWNTATGDIVFASAKVPGTRLWRLDPEDGSEERIQGVGENASFVAISRSGTRLAYARSVIDTNIWRFELPSRPAAMRGTRILSSTRLEQGPQISPAGDKIVFASNRTGAWEIWLSDAAGTTPVQLTNFNGAPAGTPDWSPDGKWIAFDSRQGGEPNVYIIPAEGGTARRLTQDATQDIVPTWSRDGKHVYFASNRSGRWEVFRIPAEGGAAVQVTQQGGFYARESPDRKYVYYAKGLTEPGLWRVPHEGGIEEEVLKELPAGYWAYWMVVENGVYFVERREIEKIGMKYYLNFYDARTKQTLSLMELAKRPYNAGLSVSRDRKWFLYTQVDQSDMDIFLVDDFR